MDYAAGMDKADADKFALAGERLKLQQGQMAMADDQAARAASIASGGDQNKLLQLLQSGGNYKAALALQKANVDAAHVGAQTGKLKSETAGIDSKNLRDDYKAAANQVWVNPTPDSARAAVLQIAAKYGTDPTDELLKIRQFQTPEQIKQWAAGHAMEAEHMQTDETTRANHAATVAATLRGQDVTAATAKAGQAVTMRGQDMTDARSRESNSAAMTKPFEVTGPDGPMLVQQDKQGNIKPVEGFQPKGMGATKLTEAQGNATNFAARMKDASVEIEALEKKGVSSSDLRTKAAGSEWTNWLASSEGQQYRQAQENWVTANLRKESGAAISVDEMAKDIAKWFPKAGDGKDVRAQKAHARQVAEEGMLVQAGPGAKQVQGILDRSRPAAGKAESGWTVTEVKGK
jgi:hypothetical protein